MTTVILSLQVTVRISDEKCDAIQAAHMLVWKTGTAILLKLKFQMYQEAGLSLDHLRILKL